MKTHLLTKKRALISSVAMLLVAIIALGTATFAWFSSSTQATANSITANTSSASNLVITDGKAQWTNRLTFSNGNFADIMNPVTTTDFGSFKSTIADDYDGGVSTKTLEQYTDATAGTDYSSTFLYVKNDTADATETMDIKIAATVSTANGTGNFLRIALVPNATTVPENATPGLKSFDTKNTGSAIVYGDAKDDFGKNPLKFTALDAENTDGEYSTVTTTDKTLETKVTLTGSQAIGYKVLVWYEGADPNCRDSAALNASNVSFTVSKVSK